MLNTLPVTGKFVMKGHFDLPYSNVTIFYDL